MTDEERFCKKRCNTNPCKHRCPYVNYYLDGVDEGRRATIEKYAQVDRTTIVPEETLEEENVELKKENNDLRKGIEQFQSDNEKFIKRIGELEDEKCELLGIIQGKDKVIAELKEVIGEMEE